MCLLPFPLVMEVPLVGQLSLLGYCLISLHFPIAPNDYTFTETDLTFTPDNSRMCVNIPVTKDTVVEGNENFTVTVTSNDPTVQIGPNSNSTVTIVDDDGMQLTDSTIATGLKMFLTLQL